MSLIVRLQESLSPHLIVHKILQCTQYSYTVTQELTQILEEKSHSFCCYSLLPYLFYKHIRSHDKFPHPGLQCNLCRIVVSHLSFPNNSVILYICIYSGILPWVHACEHLLFTLHSWLCVSSQLSILLCLYP